MPKSLRLPPDLDVEIKRLAKEHDRSENAEIIVAVRRYIQWNAELEASKYDDDVSVDEAECAVLHPGLTHEEYKIGSESVERR